MPLTYDALDNPTSDRPADRHAREAVRLAAQANHYTYGDGADPVAGAALAAEGQIYATLALAAVIRERPLLTV